MPTVEADDTCTHTAVRPPSNNMQKQGRCTVLFVSPCLDINHDTHKLQSPRSSFRSRCDELVRGMSACSVGEKLSARPCAECGTGCCRVLYKITFALGGWALMVWVRPKRPPALAGLGACCCSSSLSPPPAPFCCSVSAMLQLGSACTNKKPASHNKKEQEHQTLQRRAVPRDYMHTIMYLQSCYN